MDNHISFILLLVKLFCFELCKFDILVVIVDKSLFKSNILDLFKIPSDIFTSLITVNSSQTKPALKTLVISYLGILLLNQLSFIELLVKLGCLEFSKFVKELFIFDKSSFKSITLDFDILLSGITMSFNIN